MIMMNDLDMTKVLETARTVLEPLFSALSDYSVIDIFIFGISVLTVFAFIGLIRVRWFYKQEQTQLDKLERVLEKLEKQPIGTVGKLRNHLLLAFDKSFHTLVYERIEFVLKLAENGKLGRIQAAAETMLPRKLARQQGYFAHFVISVLLIIGLAATLWAFEDILTNSGLNSAIQGNEIKLKEYTPAIKNIYDGLQSAMLASLAGIIGTIFLLFIKFRFVQPVQERFFSHLDWITEFYLIPICSQFEHKKVEQTLLHTTEKLAQVVGGIENISQEMQSNVKHSNSLVQELNAYAENLVQKLNVFTEKTGEVVNLFERVTNKDSSFYQVSTQLFTVVKAMGGNYGKLTNRIDELVTEHNKSISRYETYIIHLEETQKGFTDSQTKLVEDVGKIPEGFQEAINSHASILQANKRYLGLLEELTDNLKIKQSDYTDHVTEAADSMAASLKGVNEATEQLDSFMTKFNEGTESLIPELTKLGVDPLLHQYVEELKNSLIRTQNEFMASIQQQQETMQEEFNQMDSLKQIEQSVESMHNLLKERQKSWLSSLFSSLFKKG